MKSIINLLFVGLICAASFHYAQAQEPAFRNSLIRELEDQGFEHFYNLEYDLAIESFQKMLSAEPQSAAAQNHIAVSNFYKQMLVAGLLEGDLFTASNQFFRLKTVQTDPVLIKEFQEHNRTAIQICEKRLKENDKDQNALFDCGVAYGNRAAYFGLIEQTKVDTLKYARKAQDFHQRLLLIDPHRYDAFLVPGIYDFMLGSLPRSVRFLLFLGGFVGDKARGIQMVESAATGGDRSKHDAEIVLAVLYRREQRYDDARRTLEALAHQFPRNYLFPLEVASIYRRAGNDAEALPIYQQVLKDIAEGRPGFSGAPLARIHFELGEIFAKRGELENAKIHLQEVDHSRGANERLILESIGLLAKVSDQIKTAQNKADNH